MSQRLDIVERALRAALDEIVPEHIDGSPREFPSTEKWDLARRVTIAVISAMRQPTAEMIEAGHYDALAEDAEATWKSMIDAALNPPLPR